MSYRHLSIIERSKLEILHRQGQSARAIAKELGRHPSTICRELDRVAASQPIRQNKLKTLMRSVVRLLSLEVNGQTPWLLPCRKSFRRRGLQNKSPNVSARKACQLFPSKPSIAGSTLGAWFKVYYRFFGTKGSVRNPQKLAVNSPMVDPFRIAPKRYVPVKRLGTGDWIPSYRVVGKVKAAWPR